MGTLLEISIDGGDLVLGDRLAAYCEKRGIKAPASVVRVDGIDAEVTRLKHLVKSVANDQGLTRGESDQLVDALGSRSLALKRMKARAKL